MTTKPKRPQRTPKPSWLKRRLPSGPAYGQVRALLEKGHLHTVCQEAQCPNIWECYSCHTATFLIMGPRCTRNCRFCAVGHGPSGLPDPDEPVRVAQAAEEMQLRYVVITSVTRDDLPDGGAGHFARTLGEIHRRRPDVLTEVLIPDFQGDAAALETVINARPDVLNHNLETVSRLYSRVRPDAVYSRSLALLKQVKAIAPNLLTKSGLMLGLGETPDEVRQSLRELLDAGCAVLTLGQYLQPTREHLPVERFVPPEAFDEWREIALKMGFSEVASGPFVRSSYHANAVYEAAAKQPSE